jgi:hypothetical protein
MVVEIGNLLSHLDGLCSIIALSVKRKKPECGDTQGFDFTFDPTAETWQKIYRYARGVQLT